MVHVQFNTGGLFTGRLLTMTSEERERMNRLCNQIQGEKDGKRLSALVSELDELLENRGTNHSVLARHFEEGD